MKPRAWRTEFKNCSLVGMYDGREVPQENFKIKTKKQKKNNNKNKNENENEKQKRK